MNRMRADAAAEALLCYMTLAVGDLVMNTEDVMVSDQLTFPYYGTALKVQVSWWDPHRLQLLAHEGCMGVVIDAKAGGINDMAVILLEGTLVAVWKDRIKQLG